MAEDKKQPTPEGKVEKQPEEVNVEALLEALQKVNVTTPEDLDGMARASKEAGRIANKLGEANKRIADLTAKLNSVQSTPVRNLDDVQEGQTINLEEVIGKTVRKELTALEQEKAEKQRQFQEMVNTNREMIESDEDYPIVKDVFEKRMADPRILNRIRMGETTPYAEYEKTVRQFLKEHIKQSTEVLQKLTGKKTPIPHVEQGEQAPQNLVSDNEAPDPIKKRFADLTAQVDKGKILTDEEELEMASLMFGVRGQPKK